MLFKQEKIESILANLFFVFFIAQILSPSINDKTIYLEWIIAILNPFFWLWILDKHINTSFLMCVVFLSMIIVIQPMTGIKLFLNTFGIIYLIYLYNRNLFYLNRYIFFSIFLGILQLSFILSGDIASSKAIGPSAIAEMIWGSYATASFTNFYDAMGIGIPRVSGFSREAGFFAALLESAILLNYLFRRRGNKNLISKKGYIIYSIGYIISFSKMSLGLVLLFIIEKGKKYINVIPKALFLLLFLIIMCMFWLYNVDFLIQDGNQTFLDRFGAYATFFDLNISQMLLGTPINTVDSYAANLQYVISFNTWFAGFCGWILQNGLVVLFLWYMCLHHVGVNTAGIFSFIVLTLNVQPDTNQNFVILSYFILIMFYRDLSYDKLQQTVSEESKCVK